MLKQWWRDERGAAASEYILLLGVLAGGVAFAAYAYGKSVEAALENRGTQLLTDPSGDGSPPAAPTPGKGNGNPNPGTPPSSAPGQNPGPGNGNSNGNQTPGKPSQ
jgi:Flp pilus assembly pilin Flp